MPTRIDSRPRSYVGLTFQPVEIDRVHHVTGADPLDQVEVALRGGQRLQINRESIGGGLDQADDLVVVDEGAWRIASIVVMVVLQGDRKAAQREHGGVGRGVS